MPNPKIGVYSGDEDARIAGRSPCAENVRPKVTWDGSGCNSPLRLSLIPEREIRWSLNISPFPS